MKRPYDYYGKKSVEGNYPLDVHGVGPMSSGNTSSPWYRQREASVREKSYRLGFHGCQRRDRHAFGVAFQSDHDFKLLGFSNQIDGSYVNLYNSTADDAECSLKSLRESREVLNMGDPMVGCPVDPCKIMHVSSSQNALNEKGKELLLAPRVRMEEPFASPQSRRNFRIQEFSLQKHIDSSSGLADGCRMTLEGRFVDYGDQWRERSKDVSSCKNMTMEPLIACEQRPFEKHSSHGFYGSELLTDVGHDDLHHSSESARCKGLFDGTSSDYMNYYRYRDQRGFDEIDNMYPEFPRYSKSRHLLHDDSQELLTSGQAISGGGSQKIHRRPLETCISLFRTYEHGGSSSGTGNVYCRESQEREMGNDQLKERWRVERAYSNYAYLEDKSSYNMRTSLDDSLHKVPDGKSLYLYECPSETWACQRSGTGNDYYTSPCEKEMSGNRWREERRYVSDYYTSPCEKEMSGNRWTEKRRFVSTFEKYPSAEPSSPCNITPSHDYSPHRVATSGLEHDSISDCMHQHWSERLVSRNRHHNPQEQKRKNAQNDGDSVQNFEKEKDFNDNNVRNNLHKPYNEQYKKDSALLDNSNSIQKPELNENSEEYRQHVHNAYLRFSKLLNENSDKKKRYQAQGKSGSLLCIVCGRYSKYFGDAHSLAMHTYDYQKAHLLAEHKGFYKALCSLLGWNQDMPPSNSRSYQSLGLIEARANQENLILWPPLVIVQNARLGQGKDGYWEGIGNAEMDELLKELGFGSGKSKAIYGKEGHKGIILVKFSSSFAGLEQAEQLHKYFEGYCRGRKDWLRLQSLHTGKENNNEGPAFVRIDKDTQQKKRVLYGYIGIAEDLETFDFDTRKRIFVKCRRDMEKRLKGQ